MTKIQIGYDDSKKRLTLSGVGPALTRNPMFAAHFNKENGTVGADGTLYLSTSSNGLSQQYRTVSKLLAYAGVEAELESGISTALDAVRVEAEDFARFSVLAAEIWGREIDTDEFQKFVSAVETACGRRTFYRKQLLSAFHLSFARNACNFSVPGAGKTSIVYAAYAFLKSLPIDDSRRVDRLLIVGPLSSFKAWEDEYKAIFGHPAKSKRISGAMPMPDRMDHLILLCHKSSFARALPQQGQWPRRAISA